MFLAEHNLKNIYSDHYYGGKKFLGVVGTLTEQKCESFSTRGLQKRFALRAGRTAIGTARGKKKKNFEIYESPGACYWHYARAKFIMG